ncbi:unnamed protein product [Musa acuminata subsp. burmannicoides]
MASWPSQPLGTATSASGMSPPVPSPRASWVTQRMSSRSPSPPDNCQIVSRGRDRTIKVWNSLGECKCTIEGADAHTEWVSCVRFSPNFHKLVLVSGSWDRTVKVWNFTNRKLMYTLVGHTGYVNAVAVTPDGTMCASGGKDTLVLLWELAIGAKVHEFNAGSIIHAICFSPRWHWLCVASENDIRIWDLAEKTLLQVSQAGDGRRQEKETLLHQLNLEH